MCRPLKKTIYKGPSFLDIGGSIYLQSYEHPLSLLGAVYPLERPKDKLKV